MRIIAAVGTAYCAARGVVSLPVLAPVSASAGPPAGAVSISAAPSPASARIRLRRRWALVPSIAVGLYPLRSGPGTTPRAARPESHSIRPASGNAGPPLDHAARCDRPAALASPDPSGSRFGGHFDRGERREGGKGRENQARECKWGRHRCRPHSHRCVVFRPGRAICGSAWRRCFSGCPANRTSRFCHRRSRRHPVPSGGECGSEDLSSAARRFRDRSNRVGRRSRTVLRRLAPSQFLDLRPDRPASRRRCFRVLLKRCTCIRPKPSAGVPRRPRGQFPSRRNGLESFMFSGR